MHMQFLESNLNVLPTKYQNYCRSKSYLLPSGIIELTNSIWVPQLAKVNRNLSKP